MTPGRAAAYIGGLVLLAAWLSSAAPSPQDVQAPPAPRPEATAGTDSIANDVQAQAARLRARLAEAPAPQLPLRNPFAFAVREVPRLRAAGPDGAAPEPLISPESPVVDELELRLVGVAEQQSPGGVVRTAMIVGAADDLFLVTEGQDVAGRYRVTAVAADAVELRDVSTGAVRRLGLR